MKESALVSLLGSRSQVGNDADVMDGCSAVLCLLKDGMRDAEAI